MLADAQPNRQRHLTSFKRSAMTQDTTVPKLVTVIITTSPTPSAPSTELVSAVLESFEEHCHALTLCNVIVVFDTFDQIVPTARLKKGQVTPQQAADFDEYKKNVKELILMKYRHVGAKFTQRRAMAEYGSPNPQNTVDYTISQTSDKKVTFIEPSRRLGFGLAVRSALRVTQTPFVWVQQHDWALVADFPVAPLVHVMKAYDSHPETPIKYICLAAIRMLSHAISEQHPILRKLSSSLTQKYEDPAHPGVKIPLTPIYFWHDKPHLASTAHYLERVFPSRLAMLRGDFIEDKIGQRARAQMKDGLWTKWATWLYYPDDGKQLCLKHLQGRTWAGTERQADRAAMWRERNEAERAAQDDS